MKKLRNIDYAKTSREQNIKGALKERKTFAAPILHSACKRTPYK